MSKINLDIPVISIRDVIDVYYNFKKQGTKDECVLSYMSQLTGISKDALLELVEV